MLLRLKFATNRPMRSAIGHAGGGAAAEAWGECIYIYIYMALVDVTWNANNNVIGHLPR